MPNKVGRPAFKPTATQRRRIMRGIAVGLSLQQLADDLGVPLGTMRRAFDSEIKLGRVRLTLENVDRLHAAADRGAVSAMRELARLMQDPARSEGAEDEDVDEWADATAGHAILNRNTEIH